MIKEIWKEIPYHPFYDVSNLGRVRSWKKTGPNKNNRIGSAKILKNMENKYGYFYVDLCIKQKRVNRLVLEAFVGPCPEGMESCHYNGIKKDNRLENLRWDTHINNAADNIKHGKTLKGVSNPNSKLNKPQAIEIKKRILNGESNTEISKYYPVGRRTISSIRNDQSWSWLDIKSV